MRKLAILFALLVTSLSAHAEEMSKVGSGKYYWKGLIHAYDAALYAPAGQFHWNKPFILELVYKTDIDGEDIAERSIQEMNKIEKLDKEKSAKWLEEMKAIFPNVVDGTSLRGTNVPGKGIAFQKDGTAIGGINDAEFAKRFFEIWLSPKSSDKKLRAKLLGEKK